MKYFLENINERYYVEDFIEYLGNIIECNLIMPDKNPREFMFIHELYELSIEACTNTKKGE